MTGLSMGGFGTWNFAIDYPDLVAAIAPICGVAEKEWVPRIKSVPVWAFHGEADPTVPFAQDQASVDALKAAGGNVRFTTYAGVGHDSWTRAYATDELYIWLMAQSTK
jgi:predicted peptidase